MEAQLYPAALLLIAANPKGVTAINMLAHYDFVDRGSPSSNELFNAINYLYAHDLIERHAKKYKRTEAGERIYNSAKQKSEYETAKAIERVLEALPELQPGLGIISSKEAAFAVKAYNRLGCLLVFWPF